VADCRPNQPLDLIVNIDNQLANHHAISERDNPARRHTRSAAFGQENRDVRIARRRRPPASPQRFLDACFRWVKSQKGVRPWQVRFQSERNYACARREAG
jgi:hypothetical protein